MAEEKDAGKTENRKDYRRGLRMFMRLFEPETQIFLDALHAWEYSETKPAQTKKIRVLFLILAANSSGRGSGSGSGSSGSGSGAGASARATREGTTPSRFHYRLSVLNYIKGARG
jgi:hypothetical protein